MYHEPVLKEEVITYLLNDKNGIYLDGTLGGGGHSELILNNLTSKGTLIGLDMDNDARIFASKRLREWANQLLVAKKNFRDFDSVLQGKGITKLNGILLDLGVSSYQIDTPDKGFSFSKDGALDMRMDETGDTAAVDLINTADQDELIRIFREYGEERHARRIAKIIVTERQSEQIRTTFALANLVNRVSAPQHRVKTLARIFQALRIAVNDELQNLQTCLQKSIRYLKQGGRIVVISYHSLEDRIVKNFFKNEAAKCECPPELPICICDKKDTLKILTRRPITASAEELKLNTRSRSAKLRAAEFIL